MGMICVAEGMAPTRKDDSRRVFPPLLPSSVSLSLRVICKIMTTNSFYLGGNDTYSFTIDSFIQNISPPGPLSGGVIGSVKIMVEKGLVRHRSVFIIVRQRGSDIFLRLDRRPSRTGSIGMSRNSGRAKAEDKVRKSLNARALIH